MTSRTERVLAASIVAIALAAGSPRDAGAARQQKKVWPGVITRTEVLTGTVNGRKVTYRRTEQWSHVSVTSEDDETAFFDTDWRIDVFRREADDRCTTTIQAHGRDRYGSLTFDANPLDEGASYQIYSAGTGEVPSVTGTMIQACRGEAPFAMPYEADASWLPARGFQVPADLLPPGIPSAPPVPDSGMVAGTIDRSRPNLLRGRSSTRAEDGTVVTVAWSLSRSADCGDESEVRQMVTRESARLQALERADAGDARGERGPRDSARVRPVSFRRALSPSAVGEALASAAGGADRILVRDAVSTGEGGIRRFALRVSRDGRILPSLPTLQQEIDSTCVPDGAYEAAPTLVLGAVQWTGTSFRVNVRSVDTETGTVKTSVSDGGSGEVDALRLAVEGLLINLLAA